MTKENVAGWLAIAAVGGLVLGATGCGGSGGQGQTPADGASAEPSGAKHHCNADNGCSGDKDMKEMKPAASAAPSAAPSAKP